MTETFSQSSFDTFLVLLDADREQAGAKSENLRQRLIKFFEWRNCEMSEELSDTVFDRVMRKIAEGEQIQNVTAYSATIAQFVFKEYLRKNERQNQLIEDAPEIQNIKAKDADNEDEKISIRQNCFDKCLKEFSAENRKFIIAYYDTERKNDDKFAQKVGGGNEFQSKHFANQSVSVEGKIGKLHSFMLCISLES